MSTAAYNSSPIVQCVGKQQFSTPQLAHKIVRRWQKSKRGKKKLERPVGVYRCPHCGWFHIGGHGPR